MCKTSRSESIERRGDIRRGTSVCSFLREPARRQFVFCLCRGVLVCVAFPQQLHTWTFFFIIICFFFAHFHFPGSGQAVVTGVIPSPPRFLPSIFIAHRVQQSHCSSIVHRVLPTHALALSASHFVNKKKSQRIYTSMHSAGLELTKLTYTRLEDNLILHRGDRYNKYCWLLISLHEVYYM